ncbi:MAG: hypothetical protein Q8O10_00440 [candidate division Zixibacteria bacterium]|nr:hypothetical protein [candidate division Zixibacteria bacterium]
MPQKLRQILWIFLVDTYILIISFALLKVIELALKSFWANEVRLLKLLDIAFTLPILLAYIFLLSFDFSELFLRKQQEPD